MKVKVYSDYDDVVDFNGNLNSIDSMIIVDSEMYSFDEIKHLIPQDKLKEVQDYLDNYAKYLKILSDSNIPEDLVGDFEEEEQFLKEHVSPSVFKEYKKAIDYLDEADTEDWEITIDVEDKTSEPIKTAGMVGDGKSPLLGKEQEFKDLKAKEYSLVEKIKSLWHPDAAKIQQQIANYEKKIEELKRILLSPELEELKKELNETRTKIREIAPGEWWD